MAPTRASKTANAVTIHAHLSEVSTSSDRDDADRRLSVLLRLQGLRRTAEASLWRLLCFLLLRFFCRVRQSNRMEKAHVVVSRAAPSVALVGGTRATARQEH